MRCNGPTRRPGSGEHADGSVYTSRQNPGGVDRPMPSLQALSKEHGREEEKELVEVNGAEMMEVMME
jgi:hypothetical protein